MEIDISSLRRDAEKIEDAALRQEALLDLAKLDNAEFDLQRRLDDINREHWDKHHAYKPQSKARLILLSVFGLLGGFFGIDKVRETLESGSLTLSRSHYILTSDANPIAYWLYVSVFIVGFSALLFGSLFCVIALLRYPHPPFKWMSLKHKS